MAQKHKKKVKGTELDGIIKKLTKMSEKKVAITMAERDRLEKIENEKAKQITSEEEFRITIAGLCLSQLVKPNNSSSLCDRTNCTCRRGLCPIMKRVKNE